MTADIANLAKDARQRMAWRVGVSGHRELNSIHLANLRQSVDRVFADLDAALKLAHKIDGADAVFTSDQPLVTVVSPLAIGADQLVADVAVSRRLRLIAPLPFPEADYRLDFPEAKEKEPFDRLLQYARRDGKVVELDGAYEPKTTRNDGYMAVGEFVVRNCDLLIAIWNGDEAAGHGGTGDVVPYARNCGVPVVHIWSEKPAEIRILDAAGEPAPYTRDALAALIGKQLLPEPSPPHLADPKKKAEEHEKRKKRQIASARRYFTGEPLSVSDTPLDFMYGGPFKPNMRASLVALSKIFPFFVGLAEKIGEKESSTFPAPPCGTGEPCTRHLFAHHHRADALASFYAKLHRSAFLLVYALGATALSFAVAALFLLHVPVPGLGIGAEYVFTGLEFVILLTILALVRMDNRFGWRDRWLEYRLLAELLREADLLAQVGRPMPMNRIDEMAEDLPGRAWVRNAYCAIVRASGFVSLKFDAAFLGKLRDYAADVRLADQIKYHKAAVSRNEAVAGTLRSVGEVAFGLTMLAATLKLTWHAVADMFALGLMAGVLPAFAYACFGIRNQAEFEIVSRRSERMIVKLERHSERLRALQGARLTSVALGREILKAAAVMRHDAADWASIFEVKETET